MSLKTVAVIPVHGRLPLVKVTIQRLLNRNGVDKVICVGSKDEAQTCTEAGAVFYEFDNKPLGKKWNYGFLKAKELNPDFVVYVGSSDWLSDNWLPVTIKLIQEQVGIEVGMVGKPDFNLIHLNNMRFAWWPGYAQMKDTQAQKRWREPIGIGRIINAKLLDKMGWRPFIDSKNVGLDGDMWDKFISVGGYSIMYNMPEIQSLSLSCDQWKNMHTEDFNDATPQIDAESWLKIWFPEALNLEL